MAIHFRSAPEGAAASVGAAFKALSAMPVKPFAFLVEEPAEVLHHPHVVYHLGLEGLVSGKGLRSATPVRWAFLVGTGGAAAGIAEVTYDRQEFSQLNEGPYASGILDAIARAEDTKEIMEGDFELNVLRIPGIYVIALWLKNILTGENVFVPVAPAPRELEALRDYSEEEFMRVLRLLAGRALPLNPPPLA